MRTEGVMAKRFDIEHPGKGLSAEEAEALFATVDNSGHVNVEQARMQQERREQYGHGVYVDPLSSDDPSGSNVGKILTRVAAVLVSAPEDPPWVPPWVEAQPQRTSAMTIAMKTQAFFMPTTPRCLGFQVCIHCMWFSPCRQNRSCCGPRCRARRPCRRRPA